MRGLALALALTAALAGCAASPPLGPNETRIAPGIVFAIPGPEALGQSLAATQLITAHVRGTTLGFESHIEITKQTIDLVGLDPFGRRALTIHWRDGVISSETAPWLPDRIRPANILADMAITYWPEDAVQAGLSASGAMLEAAPGHRRIVSEGRTVISIDYEGAEALQGTGTVHYRNEALEYDLDIQSVRIAE
jgi:hypothetical protein